MASAIAGNEWLLQPPKRAARQALAWAAVAVSLALHWLAAVEMPPIPVASPVWTPPSIARLVRVESVRPEAAPNLFDAPPFEPERVGLTSVPPPPATLADPSRIAPELPAAMPGDEPPRRAPSAEDLRAWMPRPERLEIPAGWIPDEVAALPRRIAPLVERSVRAPDVVPAAMLDPAVAAPPRPAVVRAGDGGVGPAGPPAPEAVPTPMASPPPPPVPTPPAEPAPAEPGRAPMLPTVAPAAEVAVAVRERGPDVTGVPPVEHLLRLDLFSWAPPDEPGWRYLQVDIRRAAEQVLPPLPRDILFVQDCSASMTAAKVRACREGLHASLRLLQPADRFNLLTFREAIARCFDDWAPVRPTELAQGGWFIEQMESRGMTDIYAALEAVKSMPTDPARPAIVIVISDGRPTRGLQDNFEIIQRFSDSNRGRVSVFSFGAGQNVNRFLLDFLSQKNRGASKIVRDLAAIPSELAALVREVGRPVLTDLVHRWSGVDETDIYPKLLTHLYLDRPLTVVGRVPADMGEAGVRILGRSGTNAYDMVFGLDPRTARAGGPEIRDLWVRQKLAWLIGEHIRTRDPTFRDAAIALARRLGPAMPYAAELGLPEAPVRAD
ncbi:MAG: VWA domain-containing protein [Kiritimatiellae bacterium]|nr:VWA domain-containing protein [Kiritimatiellia bacterium]